MIPLSYERSFPIRGDEVDDTEPTPELPPRRLRPAPACARVAAEGELRCSHCGGIAIVLFRGAPLGEVLRELRAFGEKHALCKPRKG